MAYVMNVANIMKTCLKKKTCIDFLHFRTISCFHRNFNKQLLREARVMRKILGNKKKGKTPWYKSEDESNIPPVPRTSAPKYGQNFRRIAVLNKLFMRHITDMMASGEVANEILGRGIEISRVKVAPDFNKVNVFWVARGTENDAVVERILKKSAVQLRQELTELHVMGVVPHIDFVKDKQYAKAAEVDRILATADFGEGYFPVDAGYQFKSEFTSLPPKIKSCVEELEDGIPEPPLPSMRMDVLGLKHDEIMNRIKKSMNKSQAVHRHEVGIPLDTSRNSELVVQNLEDTNHDIVYNLRKEDFTRFLLKRHYEQKKVLRGNKNYSPESELFENEVREMSDLIDSVKEEEDYINDNEDTSFRHE